MLMDLMWQLKALDVELGRLWTELSLLERDFETLRGAPWPALGTESPDVLRAYV